MECAVDIVVPLCALIVFTIPVVVIGAAIKLDLKILFQTVKVVICVEGTK